MKPRFFAVLSIFLLSLALRAENPWTWKDTAAESAFAACWTVDWAQTTDLVTRRGRAETNPILGKQPSRAQINQFFLVGYGLHYAVSRVLPPRYRHIWQSFSLGMEVNTIHHNYSIGVRCQF